MNLCYLLLSGLVLSSALAFPVKAQITIDGTTNTQLTPMDNGVRIDEGNRAEGNLFHSFSEFSVPKGSFADTVGESNQLKFQAQYKTD